MVETLLKVVAIFKEHGVEYCLIGGLAMLLHDGRATTVDIDFYVLVGDLKAVEKILKRANISFKKSGEYQLKAILNDIPIDILLADHYIGHDVVYRAVEKKLGDEFVRVATPEDLIITKSLADRSIDRRDIEELRELFADTLDEAYIERQLKRLKKMLEE